MEMSVREARAQFAAALAAAERGERVTITKNGRPVAELGPPSAAQPKRKGGIDWERVERVRKEMGLDKLPPLPDGWQEEFDDPAFSREVLGLDDDWEPYRP
ncbi:type II toxin-antitoxin system prevent-host-death family antitoxin [Sphingomonas cannabina]|uniref:type II toxin-antitoxin system Phd/YefM family antitoxin n=1 Tax=Sphingomonas cannabina TaxID=2899123 RepID=UPI001F3C6077|nr:type II toxin-antitoxin system prevent-host-death family antitoxin [Sphingomonas cannabina]UIJ46433.1 type II toxin-antitoxin system prevent-host-death family antitoxin [Sphingomonas cannabina]